MTEFGPVGQANSSPFGHNKVITAKAFKDVHFKGNGAGVNENSSGRIFLYFLTNFAASVSSLPRLFFHLTYKKFFYSQK